MPSSPIVVQGANSVQKGEKILRTGQGVSEANKVVPITKSPTPVLSAKRTKAREFAKAQVVRSFLPYLQTLSLTDAQRERIVDLLTDRYDIVNDISEYMTTYHLTQGTLGTSGEYRTIVRQLQKEIEEQISQVSGPDVAPNIHTMLAGEMFLANVQVDYNNTFSQNGAPISVEQTVKLASFLSAEYNPELNINTSSTRLSDIDPTTGLSASDRRILDQAQSILAPAQLQILRKVLAETTSRFLAADKLKQSYEQKK